MVCTYRIESARHGFVVFDDQQEKVGLYETRQEAEESVQSCKKDDAVWETATLMIESDIMVLMKKFDISRKEAKYWIASAAECSD
jgi:hypothetical protein